MQEISTQNEKIGGYNLFQQLWHTSKLQKTNEKMHKSEKKKRDEILFYFGPSWCDNRQKGIQLKIKFKIC